MAGNRNLLLNPLFRFGMPAMSAAVIVAMAFLVVDDQVVRMTMLLVAAVEIIATPWVLKRAAQEQAADSRPHNA